MKGGRAAIVAGFLVTVALLPPEGCRVEKVEIKHSVAVDPVVTTKLESRCVSPTGALLCTTEWREDRQGRHGVDITCVPVGWDGP